MAITMVSLGQPIKIQVSSTTTTTTIAVQSIIVSNRTRRERKLMQFWYSCGRDYLHNNLVDFMSATKASKLQLNTEEKN